MGVEWRAETGVMRRRSVRSAEAEAGQPNGAPLLRRRCARAAQAGTPSASRFWRRRRQSRARCSHGGMQRRQARVAACLALLLPSRSVCWSRQLLRLRVSGLLPRSTCDEPSRRSSPLHSLRPPRLTLVTLFRRRPAPPSAPSDAAPPAPSPLRTLSRPRAASPIAPRRQSAGVRPAHALRARLARGGQRRRAAQSAARPLARLALGARVAGSRQQQRRWTTALCLLSLRHQQQRRQQ
jgi:hypothetical protein